MYLFLTCCRSFGSNELCEFPAARLLLGDEGKRLAVGQGSGTPSQFTAVSTRILMLTCCFLWIVRKCPSVVQVDSPIQLFIARLGARLSLCVKVSLVERNRSIVTACLNMGL